MRFRDRTDAGRQLGVAVAGHGAAQPLVVGLARGGVVVAAEVARQLDAPLRLTVVSKLGHPAHPELGLGALAEDGVPVWNEPLPGEYALAEHDRYEVLAEARAEMRRRRSCYWSGLLPPSLAGRTVLLVDDGLATGGSARAAIGFVHRRGAARVVFAVPVAAPDVACRLRTEVADLVTLIAPADLTAVGQWYARFDQCTDDDVMRLLPEGHDLHSS